ncbi:MAG: T9SS type A sorting domain-containing protein [Bacteroidota bacterium]
MKTVLLRYWCAFLALGAVIPSIGQNNLRYGTAQIPRVVETPTVYYDLLRSSSKGWLHQTLNPNTMVWEDFEKASNLRDADGNFTELGTKIWEGGSQSWETEYQSNYQYQKDANNRVIEMIYEVQSPFDDYTLRYTYTYDQNRLSEVEVAFKNGAVFYPSTHTFIQYNSLGQRVLDSMIDVNTSEAISMREYAYDNAGNCFRELGWGKMQDDSWDTTSMNQYEYFGNGKLKTRTFYYQNAQGNLLDNFRDEYSYTSTGNVNALAMFIRLNPTMPLFPYMYYKNYYDGENKARIIVSKEFSLGINDWINSDSILLNYVAAGGGYDTSYIHTRLANGSGWSATPTQRLVFEKNATGIKQVANNTLKIAAYPNPASTNLFVEINAQIDGEATLELTDLTGKILKTQALDLLKGQSNNIEIDITDVPQGLYLLHAGNQPLKIIKE